MSDVLAMLERQARWQRGRTGLPWEEKLRMALVMREALLLLRGSADIDSTSGGTSGEPVESA
jgi:hypothetical protein